MNEKEWYYDCLASLSAIGILKGEDGKIFPDREITREEAATLIKRCVDAVNSELKAQRESSPFIDADEISDYAKENVDILYRAGVINGDGTGRFCPKDNLSRGEASAMVYNVLNIIGGEIL